MSKTKSFIFKGKQSFSSSKLEQLSKKFTELNKFETNIESHEIYFVEVKNDNSDLENLKDILSAKNLTDKFNFYVGPRLGTISPWASKTEDILKNVGLNNIERIEKLNGFTIGSSKNPKELNLSMFYDRMTQSVYKNVDDFKNLFKSDNPRSLQYIEIIEKGIKELVSANKSYGFAMSNDEIEYLYDFYTKEKRNPTDAELMMFAQANSEHCRHKIFNAKWNVDGKRKIIHYLILSKKQANLLPME